MNLDIDRIENEQMRNVKSKDLTPYSLSFVLIFILALQTQNVAFCEENQHRLAVGIERRSDVFLSGKGDSLSLKFNLTRNWGGQIVYDSSFIAGRLLYYVQSTASDSTYLGLVASRVSGATTIFDVVNQQRRFEETSYYGFGIHFGHEWRLVRLDLPELAISYGVDIVSLHSTRLRGNDLSKHIAIHYYFK